MRLRLLCSGAIVVFHPDSQRLVGKAKTRYSRADDNAAARIVYSGFGAACVGSRYWMTTPSARASSNETATAARP